MKHKVLKLSALSLAILGCVNNTVDSSMLYTTGNKNGKYFQWNDYKIFYRVNGSGKPLLLIHDLNVMSSGADWAEVISKLSDSYTIYSIDLPGCGKSDKPSITYTSYFYVQMLSAFIKEVIKETPAVVASGLSSTFPLIADSLDPELLGPILLLNPPSPEVMGKKPGLRSQILQEVLKIPVLGRTLYYFALRKENIEDYLSEKAFYNPFELRKSYVQTCYEAAHRGKGSGRFLLAALEGRSLNANLFSILKKTSSKITIIYGECAKNTNNAVSYTSLNESITVKSIEKTKLLPQLENPDDLCSLIRSSC